MKHICGMILSLCLLIGLCACGGQKETAPAWQEQYDLGIKYLADGNYEEAIIAFTAVIDIDPKNVGALTGRGQAYALSGDTEANLAAALADFEAVLAVDETLADGWLGLADVYIRMGDYDKALEVLQEGLDKTGGDEAIANKIAEMQAGTFSDSAGKTRKSCHYENGELVEYWLYEYDQKGNNITTTKYRADGTWENTIDYSFNEQGQETGSVTTSADGGTFTETYTYDAQGRKIREDQADEYRTSYTLISYDESARTETHEKYSEDGTLENRFIMEYDAAGIRRKGSSYLPDENGQLYLDYYVEYIWNEDGSYGGYHRFEVAEDRGE